MMEYINHFHSTFRWIVLILAIFAIYRSLVGMLHKNQYTNVDDKAGLFLTTIIDIQLVLGLFLYFTSAKGLKNIQSSGMASIMKDSFSRFFAVEHIAMMLIAVVLVHIGRIKSKNSFTDYAKHKNAFWYYTIALLIILISIPWPFRKGFEGMSWM